MKVLIYTDGACRGNPGPGSCAFIFVNEAEKKPFYNFSKYLGGTTNNTAEYEAIIIALKEAETREIKHIEVYSDSQLVVNQVNGIWKVRKSHLLAKYESIIKLKKSFDSVIFKHVRRENRFIAISDKLCNDVLDQN